MDIQKKSLIDNWSLEQAGFLLEGNNDYLKISDQLFTKCIGGLSNYINSILLYDETNYLANLLFVSQWVFHILSNPMLVKDFWIVLGQSRLMCHSSYWL